MVKKTAALFLFVLMSACVGTTTIVSHPSGAEVYVRDTLAGITPYVYQDIRVSFTSQKVVVKKDGHQAQILTLHRSKKFEPRNLLGAPLIYPLFYLANYADTTHINLEAAQLQPSNEMDEQTLLDFDVPYLQTALTNLETAYQNGELTRKAYQTQRKALKRKLRIAKKAN
jgi:hypothetical protein